MAAIFDQFKSSGSFLLWLLLVCGLTACSTFTPDDFDKPEVRLVSLRPQSIDNMEARFEIRLRVLNPNPTGITIEGLYTEVFLDGRRVLSGTSNDSSRIPAYGEGDVALIASIGMLESISLVRDLAEKRPTAGLPYTLKTKLSISGWPVAIRLQHEGILGTP